MTQCEQILKALESGERLTPLIALESFGCLSLSQRVGELKRKGFPIASEKKKLANGKWVAEYRLG
jgi:hypothetical protein